MICFTLTLTMMHPEWDKPMGKIDKFMSSSLSNFVKMLHVSGEQACELKKEGKTTFVNRSGITLTLEITEDKST